MWLVVVEHAKMDINVEKKSINNFCDTQSLSLVDVICKLDFVTQKMPLWSSKYCH